MASEPRSKRLMLGSRACPVKAEGHAVGLREELGFYLVRTWQLGAVVKESLLSQPRLSTLAASVSGILQTMEYSLVTVPSCNTDQGVNPLCE